MAGSLSTRQKNAAAAKRKRAITRGQSLSTRQPGFVETIYDYLDKPLEVAYRATGLDPRAAYQESKKLSGGVEEVLAPASVERALRGTGGAEDYINAALVAAPFAAKPVARVLRAGVKAAGPKAARAAKFAARPSYLSDKEAVRYVREGRAADRALAAKPKFTRSETGPFLRVEREGLEPQIVPEAKEAKDIDALRVILQTPETNPAARAASEYTQQAFGRPYELQMDGPGTSLQKQSGIARAFQAGVEGSPEYKSALFEAYGAQMPEVVEAAGAQSYDDLVEAAYRQLGKETKQQFASLPVRTSYHYGAGEYPTPSAMLRDVLGEGNLNVYRGGDPHEFLGEIDPETDLSLNEMFRAVHDFYGHGTTGSTFRPGGEEAAYASHSQMMSPLAQMALLAETRGQNSLVNYSPLNAKLMSDMNSIRRQIEQVKLGDRMRGQPGASAGEIGDLNRQLRELGAQTEYAPQTTLLLPPEYLAPETTGGIPDYLRDVIKPVAPTGPERAVHLSRVEGLSATDPSFYGTGHRGDDWRVRGAKGSPAEKTSFYLGPEGTVVPESMVAQQAPFAYETQLKGLYDIGQDPEQLVTLAKAYNRPMSERDKVAPYIPDLMRMVREYGYAGVRNPNFGGFGQAAADVFDPVELMRRIERGERGFAEGGNVEGTFG